MQLLIGLGLSVVLIYLVIVVNFQSWLDPFIIISALPAALAGITWALFLTGTTLVGAGADRGHHVHGHGDGQHDSGGGVRARPAGRARRLRAKAAIEAGTGRIRPVLMTALAMIVGMVPMSLSNTTNAPLGRAVIGGLIVATFTTLLFVPNVFAIVHRGAKRPEQKAAGHRDAMQETAA